MVQDASETLGLKAQIDHLPDPRVEAESHYYNAKHSKLVDLGLRPHLLSNSLLDSLVNIAVEYRDRVDQSLFLPQVNWRNSAQRPAMVSEHHGKRNGFVIIDSGIIEVSADSIS